MKDYYSFSDWVIDSIKRQSEKFKHQLEQKDKMSLYLHNTMNTRDLNTGTMLTYMNEVEKLKSEKTALEEALGINRINSTDVMNVISIDYTSNPLKKSVFERTLSEMVEIENAYFEQVEYKKQEHNRIDKATSQDEKNREMAAIYLFKQKTFLERLKIAFKILTRL